MSRLISVHTILQKHQLGFGAGLHMCHPIGNCVILGLECSSGLGGFGE